MGNGDEGGREGEGSSRFCMDGHVHVCVNAPAWQPSFSHLHTPSQSSYFLTSFTLPLNFLFCFCAGSEEAPGEKEGGVRKTRMVGVGHWMGNSCSYCQRLS